MFILNARARPVRPSRPAVGAVSDVPNASKATAEYRDLEFTSTQDLYSELSARSDHAVLILVRSGATMVYGEGRTDVPRLLKHVAGAFEGGRTEQLPGDEQ